MRAEKSNGMGLFVSFNIRGRPRFEELKKGIGHEIKEIWDIYIDKHQKVLVHISISSLSFEEILEERKRLSNNGLILLGIELVRQNIIDNCIESPRKKGCFWATDWLAPDFSPTKKPKLFKEIKRRMEKDSGWLKGGPK